LSNNYSIEKILKGCLKKQSKFQRALVEQYSGHLLVICKRYLNNDESAKDLVQDSLIKIFKNLKKFDKEKGSFKSWITTISIRLCLSKLQKNNLQVLSLNQTKTEPIFAENQLALDSINTEYLLNMIMELPDGYREVFNLAIIDGYSHLDISKLLNISEEVSRSRLSRARKKLRSKIENLTKKELWVNSI